MKVKKKSLLTAIVILSVLLVGIGTAFAVTGVEDAVPGTDIVIPMICEGNQPNDGSGNPVGDVVFGSLDTIWAIAETSGPSCVLDASVCTPYDLTGAPKTNVPGVAVADVSVYDKTSILRLDLSECWSAHDVISSDCQIMINGMNEQDRDAMEVTINGVTYFAGYVIYTQLAACNTYYPDLGSPSTLPSNALISWVYLNDISKGFVTGFNGISMENGVGPELEEICENSASCAGLTIGVTASDVFPRYFIMNDDPDTFNWWIFLLGRNEYAIEGDFGLVPANNMHRTLQCYFCDENENCKSNNIPIPYELNILRVASYIPGSVYLSSTYPKAGFAYCSILETGAFTGHAISTITGTLSFDDGATLIDPDPYAETYSLFGWAYQRAYPAGQKLAVVHTIHRDYCDDEELPNPPYVGDARELPNRFDITTGTAKSCSITGYNPNEVAP